jgi:A/G-specific adenine glycosylase
VNAAAVRAALLAWYRANKRDLPWRRTRDPYAIWISEAMLQQTRVETVIPYWERFLARFPDVGALATADVEDVYALWAGLGYYSRARNLHAAARAVADRHAGRLPDDAEALRALPGIGRYTAGAIASIAFDRPEPILDGNVERVLARVLALREDVKSKPAATRLWDAAAALAGGPAPGDLNQALMELGALVCTPRAPRCLACPLVDLCAARRAGDAESLPVRAPKAPPRAVRAVAALLSRGGRALFVKRPPGGLLGGLWELPGGELARGEKAEDALRRHLRERVGLELDAAAPAGEVEHVFTHRRLRLQLFRGEAAPGRVHLAGFEAHRWLAPARSGELAHGALTRKALRRLGAADAEDGA